MRCLILFLALALAGCLSTQEMPLAPNVVRLDTHASGAFFTPQTVPQTMRRAAELTLQSGYTRFRFADASTQQGDRLAGVYSSASAQGTATGNAYTYGNFTNANISSSETAEANSVPIYQSTSDIGVTVIMLHPGDPGFDNAFDAKAVLLQYK